MTSLKKNITTALIICFSLVLSVHCTAGNTKTDSSVHCTAGNTKPDSSVHCAAGNTGPDSPVHGAAVNTGTDSPVHGAPCNTGPDSPVHGAACNTEPDTSGQYVIGSKRLELRDTARGNRKVTFVVWYPVSNREQPATEGEERSERFPVICFAHGYQHPGDRYGNLVEKLVPAGYIMISLTTLEGPFPSHRGYAEEIRFLADAVAGIGFDTLSPVYGIADTLICLMGHSMGGGAMFHAAADNQTINAVIALAPYNTRPSAIEAAGSVRVPTLILSGTADCITPPEKNHLPIYERSAAEDKTYISIINGSHCGMGALRKCFTAEKLAGCAGGLGTEDQTVILARYIIPWLDCFLKGKEEQGAVFNQTLASDKAVTWLRTRPLPEPDQLPRQ